MVWLGEFLVHVADEEDTALAATSGIFAQSCLSDGLSLGSSPQTSGVASNGSQTSQLPGRSELVGEVGKTQGSEGGPEHSGLLDGESVGVNVEAGVTGGEAGVGVVTALVIVVLHVQVGELGVLYPQGATVVVDILTV